MRRILLLALTATGIAWAAPAVNFAPVLPGQSLAFPRDHGAHPDYRTEWWYVTGWLEGEGGAPLGFQVTFFRTRTGTDPANPSAFAPRQIIFAHAALSDSATGELVHDQQMAREGFGIAAAGEGDAGIRLLDWSFERSDDGRFQTRVPARDFVLELAFTPTQPVMANGEGGFSRKGPGPGQASHYYSMPQLAVSGSVTRQGRRMEVRGSAWLDREWSSTLLDPSAVGWDWTGVNFDDGGALMAFRVRDGKGASLYAGGTFRHADGRQQVLGPGDVRFVPRRHWRSPDSGAVYPVEAEFVLRLPEGERRVPLRPLFDAQELDGRARGMPAYWEGAVSTPGGRGYLELTGYAGRLQL